MASRSKWREQNRDVRPNLIGMALMGRDMDAAKLRRADLSGANLSSAILGGANHSGTRLRNRAAHFGIKALEQERQIFENGVYPDTDGSRRVVREFLVLRCDVTEHPVLSFGRNAHCIFLGELSGRSNHTDAQKPNWLRSDVGVCCFGNAEGVAAFRATSLSAGWNGNRT
jgi:hypothetical protein